MRLTLGLALAFASSVAFNWAWVEQHSAASKLAPLSVRRPLASLRLLFGDRVWLVGFSTGLGGWLLYITALALAPLSLVQAVSAGGIGLLALFAQRAEGARLPRRESRGVAAAVAGLLLLAISLAGGSDAGQLPAWPLVVAWIVASLVAAAVAAGPTSRLLAAGAGLGIAAGTMYAAGDVATKAAVAGGPWLIFVIPLLASHGLAFVFLQAGFQRGRALATAGVSSLLTSALPIAAGITLFHERLPEGPLGLARAAAFALVVAGSVLLAHP